MRAIAHRCRGPRLAVMVAFIGAVGLAGTAFARAWTSTDLAPDVDVVISMGDGGAIVPITIERMYPGKSETHRFVMALDRYSLSAHPSIVIADLEDFEQACIRPELGSGDGTCSDGEGQGELSTQLTTAVATARATGDGTGKLVCPPSPTWINVSAESILASIVDTPLPLLSGGTIAAGQGLCVEFKL